MSQVVEQIKDRLNILDVISSYIKTEKSGINFKAKCPFHNEKTPSFFISPTRQSFYCFGCQAKGDIFSFVEKFEGLDFKGSLKILADRAGVELKNFKREEKSNKKDKIFQVMEEAAKIYEKGLADSETALKYLRDRGLNRHSVLKWRIGFAKEEWRSMHDSLIKKGFSVGTIFEAGLIKRTDGKVSKYYDTFRNRIIFPISDSAGRVIAFSGRILKEDGETPKYLNSPETELFHKSEVLYGFHIAKNHIRKLDYTVLVEGQMDLLMSHQAGVLNTVASSGTALSESHLAKIQKLSNRMVIAYDSDDSGEQASKRAAVLALSLGMEVKVALLPEKEDPASLIKESTEKWKTVIRESSHFIDFALKKTSAKGAGRELTRQIVKNVLPLITLLQSDIEKSQYLKKIALKLGVSEEVVWNDLRKVEKLKEESRMENSEKQKEYPQTANLERLMTSFVFLEEIENKNTEPLKKEWEKITGKDEVKNILDSYQTEKDTLVFEAERLAAEGDLRKTHKEILRRIGLEHLKSKLQKTAAALDDKNLSIETEKKIKSDLEKIQKQIKEVDS